MIVNQRCKTNLPLSQEYVLRKAHAVVAADATRFECFVNQQVKYDAKLNAAIGSG
jgi:hypothetical protein